MSNASRRIINIANIITVLRICLIPIFIIFLYKSLTLNLISFNADIIIALLLFIIIRATDIIDGWVARVTNCCTVLGSYLDVWADFLFVFCSLITLNLLSIVPIWVTLLSVYKFSEFLLLSKVLRKYFETRGITTKKVLYYDIPGRIISALFYLLPCIVLVLKLCYIDLMIIEILCYSLLILTIVTSVLKFVTVKKTIDNSSLIIEKEKIPFND